MYYQTQKILFYTQKRIKLNTSNIITILSLIVAIYAIIPKEKKLDLKIKLSFIEYFVIIISFIITNYIILYPVLLQIGLSPNLGTWEYGLNDEVVIYLNFIILIIFISYRTSRASINRSNIEVARELFEELIFESKHHELTLLIEKHIQNIAKVERSHRLRNIIANKIAPPSPFIFLTEPQKNSYIQYFAKERQAISAMIEVPDEKRVIARNIMHRVFTNTELINHMSISRPYIFLKIVELNNKLSEDFLYYFIHHLIDNKNSIYYYELRNTETIRSHNRYVIDKNYRFIDYFLNHPQNSETHRIYKIIGDKVCDILQYDQDLVEKYNMPMDLYEKEKPTCPIFWSIHFFNIMIVESMHHKISWHMWLSYLSIFVNKIIQKFSPSPEVDEDAEFPTPFYYFISEIVSVMIGWLEEYSEVEDKNTLKIDKDVISYDNGSITNYAVIALGDIIYKTITSPKLNNDFKTYILEKVCKFICTNKNNFEFIIIITVLTKSILQIGKHPKASFESLEKIEMIYDKMDPMLKYSCEDFANVLKQERKDL